MCIQILIFCLLYVLTMKIKTLGCKFHIVTKYITKWYWTSKRTSSKASTAWLWKLIWTITWKVRQMQYKFMVNETHFMYKLTHLFPMLPFSTLRFSDVFGGSLGTNVLNFNFPRKKQVRFGPIRLKFCEPKIWNAQCSITQCRSSRKP